MAVMVVVVVVVLLVHYWIFGRDRSGHEPLGTATSFTGTEAHAPQLT